MLEGMDKKKIIAVDFDGTLCFSTWPDTGEPNQPLIDYYGNNSRKIFCDIYIDDKACVLDEFCGKCRKIQ